MRITNSDLKGIEDRKETGIREIKKKIKCEQQHTEIFKIKNIVQSFCCCYCY